MRRWWCGMLAVLLLALTAVPCAFAAGESVPPAVTASAYIVMDADSGQTLIEQQSGVRKYPASITKIMTLALALRACGGDVSQQVTVSYEAVHALEYGASHVALQPDEVVTLDDLFHATILASANDAANVLAEYTAGSMEAFAEKMNEQAAALGMTGTHFTNANGLHNDNHYTTARDMAVLTRWALTVPGFADLFGAVEYDMQPTNKQSQVRHWGTDNCMLVENKYQYEGTTGGKSGWTQEAGYTMVETVTRGRRSLVCVVLGSAKKYEKFADCIALCDYCFDNFTSVSVPAANFTPPGVPLYSGEPGADALGVAAVRTVDENYPVWLHTSLTAEDVTASFDLPEKALVNDPFTGTITLSLKPSAAAQGSMCATLGVWALAMDGGAVESLLAANEKEFIDCHPSRARGTTVLNLAGTAAVAVVCVAVLAVLRIGYVALIKAQRRKRKASQRAEAAAPYTLHADKLVQFPRPSPAAKRDTSFEPSATNQRRAPAAPVPAAATQDTAFESSATKPSRAPAPIPTAAKPDIAFEPPAVRQARAPYRPAHAAGSRRSAWKLPARRYVPAHARQRGKEEKV